MCVSLLQSSLAFSIINVHVYHVCAVLVVLVLLAVLVVLVLRPSAGIVVARLPKASLCQANSMSLLLSLMLSNAQLLLFPLPQVEPETLLT